jgi:hypothetical protein
MTTFDAQKIDEFYFDVKPDYWVLKNQSSPDRQYLSQHTSVNVASDIKLLLDILKKEVKVNETNIFIVQNCRLCIRQMNYQIESYCLRDRDTKQYYQQKYPSLHERTTFADIYGQYLTEVCDYIISSYYSELNTKRFEDQQFLLREIKKIIDMSIFRG